LKLSGIDQEFIEKKKVDQEMLNPRRNSVSSIETEVLNGFSDAIKKPFEERMTNFNQSKSDLIQMVSDGEMTVKAARKRAGELAGEMQMVVETAVNQMKGQGSPLSLRLMESVRNRKKNKTSEALQGEILEVMHRNLVELQITNRKVEFEGRTYLKNGANQVATASMEKLFEYLDESEMKEDQAAVEWVRRQMEQLRPFVVSPEIMERIDQSCDRPGSLNLRLVAKYQKAIGERISEPGFIEALLDQAIEQNDANACSAVFQMAREELQLIRPEAQLKLMAVIDKFPSQAFSDALRVDRDANRDAEARTEQFQAMSLAYIEQSARLEDAKQPSESDLKRRMEIKAREALPADEPIGLVI
jgi:hypothetical protein